MKPASILVAFCLFFLILPGAAAIGISHGSWESPILYVPGEEYSFYFVVSDYGHDASISIEGDWKDYVTLSEITSPGPGKKEFTATISPPREPDTPGMHYVYIGAKEITPPGVGVGARCAVRKQISFKVLFPYKFLTAELMAPDVNIGEPVHLQLRVTSGTLQTIREVRGSIEITDSGGALLATIPTNSVTLKLGEEKILTGTFDTTDIKNILLPATYHGRATVYYDGNITTAEDSFRVGTLAVHIINHTMQVEAGTITPFIIQVESGWNDPIENVYAEVFVDNQPVMKTPTTGLAPWEQKNMTGYFDATGWEPGQYDSTVIVHFADKSTVKMGKLIVTERRKASGGWLNLGWNHLLIAGIVLLIAILTANIFILTRQRDKKGSKKKNPKKR